MLRKIQKFMSILLIVFMIASLLPVSAVVSAQKDSDFTDIEGHLAYERIIRWWSRGIISGYGDGTFRPDNKITRAEFAIIINKVFGFIKKAENQFSDVPAGAWYGEQLLIAREAGYFKGGSGNKANPHGNITRQDAAAMLARVFELQPDTNGITIFKDADQISDYAKGDVGALVKAGGIHGYPDGTFRPLNSITRAEALIIIDEMIKTYYNEKGTYSQIASGVVLVTASDVVLKDMTIDGDLYLTEGIGEGNVTLENVTVSGNTYISGGGENGITLINSKLNLVLINKNGGGVRLVLQGNTSIAAIRSLVRVLIDIESGTSVGDLIIEEGAEGTQVNGKNRVSRFIINTDGVIVDGKKFNKGSDPKASAGGSGGSGSGGGGGTTPDTNVKVSFNLNGAPGEAPASIEIEKGKTIRLPANPTWEGHVFAGWYTTPQGGQYEAFDPNSTVNSNMTLYAQWIEEDHVKYITTTVDDKTVTIGYSTFSGIKIRKMSDNSEVPQEDLEKGIVSYGVYKDLNRNGKLDVYEDWTKSVDDRTKDLAVQMSYEEIAGLMLYSSHQTNWSSSVPTQAQVKFLSNDDLRHVLIAGTITADIAAPWNNNIQAICEKLGLGIPANNSSDPRHSAAIGVEYYSANTGVISLWPNSLGLAATFDPDLVFEFGKIASKEYRALGISTALSPQIDISTEPRWNRVNGTFGEDPKLAADMTSAYVRGFQGTFDDNGNLLGWGYDSVNAMIKHWPGGGGGEGGRDAHSDFGKYSVYPGNNFDAHLVPFVDGALQGTAEETTMATAVMPYYTISYNIDPSGKDLANAYSEYMITELLRNKYKFDGVICTDWGVDGSRGWGPDIEDLNTAQRSKILIESGIDQFGGQNTSRYILEAVELAKKEGTEDNFRKKMEESAARLLKNIFRTGLFENPYLDEKESEETAAREDFVEKGYEAQVKSIVMLKNHDKVLPLKNETKVYIPKNAGGEYLLKGANKYFTLTDNHDEADVAIVPLNSPTSPSGGMFGGGWSADRGYYPLTLQYSEYTAVKARDVSIAGDYRNIDNSSKYLNRSFKNQKVTSSNYASYQVLLDTKEAMGDKPVIAVVNLDNPMVFTEIDNVADGILVRFAASDNAVLDIISGKYEPSGLLPIQMPKDMAEVEAQYEDVPRDMACYVDLDGNEYNFAFGLNWSGVINDDRVAKYKNAPLTEPQNGGGVTGEYVTIETHTLPVGKVGEEYNAEIKVKETGATYKLIDGDLTKGLEFDNGIISGTPQETTHKYGNQLTIEASAPGKKTRIFRITLVINETGSVNLADPNELSIWLSLAKAKKESNYTSDTWESFVSALNDAQNVYDDAAAKDQDVIDNAVANLQKAMSELIRIGTPASDQVASPTASTPSGTYESTIWLFLNSATEGATIFYTLDGSEPTESSTRYTGWLVISRPAILKAIAVKEGMKNSEVSVFEYKFRASAPTSPMASGEYKTWPEVSLSSSTGGAKIYYTTDGSDPTDESTEYTEPINTGEIQPGEEDKVVIKAIAVADGYEVSNVAVFEYKLNPDLVLLTDEASIPYVIEEMTLEEKARLATGASTSQIGAAGNTYAIPRLGITGMELADGPAGVRLTNRYATAWPNPLMLASTWNTGLLAEIGAATAKEAKYYGVDFMLSPGLNLHRDPLGGRVFEYYSEDPYLAGKLGAAFVKAMQEQGIGATIKHYAANNAENNRMGIDEIISERTLRELYLPVWEIVVQESKPWAVMSSYNSINGKFSDENKYLLTDMLRDTFGFDGFVMTDWGGYHGPQGYAAGLDIYEPGGSAAAMNLLNAVIENPSIEQDLDRAIENILRAVLKTETFQKQIYDKSDKAALKDVTPDLKAEGAELSERAAAEGIVLLKNNGVLPLQKDTTVGVAGQNAIPEYKGSSGWTAPTKGIIFEGGGSACVNVNPDDVISLVEGLERGGLTVLQKNEAGEYLVEGLTKEDAEYAAANSDVGIVFIGRHGSEGSDVTSIATKLEELDMIKKLADAYHAEGKKLIVLLNVAQPIEVDEWDEYADAILYVGLPGIYGAVAITDVLTGEVNPSGKLADTWPKMYSDLPTAGNMPASNQNKIEYSEGIYIGYRYFDKYDAEPMYPFGHGLSYTTFEYSDLTLSSDKFDLTNDDEIITVSVKVTNTGAVAGKEVVQLYIRDNEASVDRPYKELKGFAKTDLLQPGESQIITFEIGKRDLSFFEENDPDDLNDGEWVAESGIFTVIIGGTSDNDVLATNGVSGEFKAVDGETSLPVIISVAEVDDITVDLGTSQEEIETMLPGQITITDSNGETHEVTLTWNLDNLDCNTPGEYNIEAVFELPEGVAQSEPETELKVTVKVIIKFSEEMSDAPEAEPVTEINDILPDEATSSENAETSSEETETSSAEAETPPEE